MGGEERGFGVEKGPGPSVDDLDPDPTIEVAPTPPLRSHAPIEDAVDYGGREKGPGPSVDDLDPDPTIEVAPTPPLRSHAPIEDAVDYGGSN
ncbi:hypothetical protein CRG98_009463 [Punica granatum]|uniref:Uncharacterized protein n=1 Tax=Punica granatum TaxID=22663 RepID=A0A2I0KNR5_PUNGR|nr:hypothetical protein CRG98_009463 [Punica granatum]